MLYGWRREEKAALFRLSFHAVGMGSHSLSFGRHHSSNAHFAASVKMSIAVQSILDLFFHTMLVIKLLYTVPLAMKRRRFAKVPISSVSVALLMRYRSDLLYTGSVYYVITLCCRQSVNVSQIPMTTLHSCFSSIRPYSWLTRILRVATTWNENNPIHSEIYYLHVGMSACAFYVPHFSWK